MAFEEQVVWTACPNGVEPGGTGPAAFQLSVHVAPRLTGGNTTLSTFPDFLDWASTPQSFQVVFDIGGQQTVAATLAADPRRNDLWQALFGAGTPVKDRAVEEDFLDHRVKSYPAAAIHDFLRQRQIDAVVGSPETLPEYESLLGAYGSIGYGAGQAQKDLQRQLLILASEREEQGVGGRPKRANSFQGATAEKSFAALRDFHKPRSRKKLEPLELPKLDFQQAVSLIGEHPRLMRLLGLVFDLEVPVTSVNLPGGETQGTVHVVPAYTGGALYVEVTPKTQAVFGAATFEPFTPSSEHNRRHLKVGNTSSFAVLRVDVDGGGLKSAFFADSLDLSRNVGKAPGQKPNPPAPDAPGQYGPPTLRSAGFAVVHHERGQKFVRRIDRSEQLKQGLPASVPDLIADDITRGYVLDVHDSATGTWHSTGARTGNYFFPTVGGGTNEPTDDEAAFDAPPTGPTDAADGKSFNLQQSIVRWDGWSLAGERPGKPIQANGQAASGIGSDPQFPVEMRLKPKPRTLPLLRFGRTYRLRMRAVDLCGNRVALADAASVNDANERVSAPQAYLRHDPVPSPDVLSRFEPVPGESLGKLVIRGNFDQESGDVSERVIAPPRMAQSLAEHHGLLDTGGVPDKTKYGLIAARESAVYPEAGLIDVGQPVPFLPDVTSRGASLVVLDGPLALKGQSTAFSFSNGFTWPDWRPFTLQLRPGAPAFQIDAGSRIVRVRLDKADEVTLKLSSTMVAGDLPLFGLFGWLGEHFNGPVSAALQALITAGRVWAFTPFQEVSCVYAVRQPLLPPTMSTSASRKPGETVALIGGGMTFSRKSTGKLVMTASWTEPVDKGPETGAPSTRDIAMKPFDIPLTPSSTPDILEFNRRHEFGDTKHRRVGYRALATSRFAEHFRVREVHKIAALDTPVTFSSAGIEPGSVRVSNIGNGNVYSEASYVVDHAGGKIAFKSGSFAPTQSVIVELLPTVTRPGPDPAVTVVRSSARPAAPRVAEVLPIFKWETTKAGKKTTSSRSASAFRVFLERPWFSSGEGELLGALTWPAARTPTTSAIPEGIAQYVSDWGADPIYGGKPLPSMHPRPTTFSNSNNDMRRNDLALDERDGLFADVAGHVVKFDVARDLWYADVALDPGRAYTPMVRLALARYQPASVFGVELSRVVLCDILQIAAGRTVTVMRGASKRIDSVTMTGYSYENGPYGDDGPGRAQVVLERRDPRYADQALGWRQVSVKTMSATTTNLGVTTWKCGRIDIPKGSDSFRLAIQQFERSRTDQRTSPVFALGSSENAFRLVHQDIVRL